jgi:16S rRNA (cytosine967-C5)-methyltransferase
VAGVIHAVRQGKSGTAAIAQVRDELRPGVQALCFQVWRNLGRAQALREQLAPRKPPPQVDALLCTVLALAWDSAQSPYEGFTLVNQAVEAAKKSASTRMQASFINACLRRFLREQEKLVASTQQDPVAVWNHPVWWIHRLQAQYPDRWKSILSAANSQAPLTLRVNQRKTTAENYIELLKKAQISAYAQRNGAIVLDHAMAVHRLPHFLDGWVSVQDAAAQIAAPLLLDGCKNKPGLRVLDACAAPGGKTGHLLEISDALVYALDVDPVRCERITQNTARLGLQAHVLAADASKPAQWWDGQFFDAILLDAPCSASGIVRRHPDVRWLRRESDISQLAVIQAELLQELWALLRPGGRMLYCTCSLFKEEGEWQVQTFLAHNTNASLRPSPGHLMPQNGAISGHLPDNQAGDNDAFYYALLEKRPD